MGFYIIAHSLYDSGQELPDPIYFLSRLGLRSAGSFNLLCFLLDPGFERAVKEILVMSRLFFRKVKYRISNRDPSLDPEAPISAADSVIGRETTSEDSMNLETDSLASTLWEDTRIAFGEWIRFL